MFSARLAANKLCSFQSKGNNLHMIGKPNTVLFMFEEANLIQKHWTSQFVISWQALKQPFAPETLHRTYVLTNWHWKLPTCETKDHKAARRVPVEPTCGQELYKLSTERIHFQKLKCFSKTLVLCMYRHANSNNDLSICILWQWTYCETKMALFNKQISILAISSNAAIQCRCMQHRRLWNACENWFKC